MKQFLLKLTEEDRNLLGKMAKQERLSMSAYVRRRVFLEHPPKESSPLQGRANYTG